MMSHTSDPRSKKSPIARASRITLSWALFFLFLGVLFVAGVAWRQLDPVLIARLDHSARLAGAVMVQASGVLAGEIAEQTREADGIILVTLVIVLIIIGGTFGATRRKNP